jgi:hypothetical protein
LAAVPSDFLAVVNSREKLIELQRSDSTLANLFNIVQSRTDDLNGRALFCLERGLLLRKWRDKTVPTVDGTECFQIVVPKTLRCELLYLAHDIPTAAHLGIAKTKARLEQHFYWPTLVQDVKQYVRTCDVCQRLGKGGKPAPACLRNLPVISEPFKRIAIDIVGPLPKCSETNNRFILTVIDHCTHYPEAIPLMSHEAPVVAKALITVFSHFGFPEEILSDCGPELMSHLMDIFLKEFGIRHIKSSPYHPECNGSCERFNGTLKSMIRAVSEQYPDTWDQTLPWILFAYREVPVETLGFSPFELLFARHVPGPLSLLKDAWLCDDVSDVASSRKSIVQFVLEMRERLRTALKQANIYAVQQKSKSKIWYDQKARERSFEEGQEILALLPLQNNPLQAKYFGPYRVLKKLGPVDYLIDTPGRRKTQRICHVNLLKPYHRREEKFFPKSKAVGPTAVVPVGVVMSDLDIEVGDNIPTLQDFKNSHDFNAKLSHLPKEQRNDLEKLLHTFADIFKDTPGKTTLITHRIELKPGSKPVAVSPYRLHPEKAAKVKQEIQEMLKLGIIVPSESEWASPIVVVPRGTDGSSIRLCTDFRRVNALSVADPFPLPRIEDLIDKLGRAKYLTKVDMTKGYWQVPLDEKSQKISATVTPDFHFEWKFLPFGLRNGPATFSRLVIKLLRGLEEFTGALLDDIAIFSESWEEHIRHLQLVFTRIQEAGLTLNLKKCEFATAEMDYLGHHVGLGKVQPKQLKVEALLAFPRPTTKKQLQSFLGLAGFYRKYFPHFSSLSAVLSDLLRKGSKFEWTEKAENAFLDIKSRLASRPVLIPPDYSKPFIVAVDASDVAYGAALLQEQDGIEHPVCFVSRKLNDCQKRYSTVEKEALALVTAVRLFSVYFGSAPVKVYTDHSPLQFLERMAPHNAKLLRWSLELQKYSLVICHRRGKDNLLPDILSRPSE